MDLKQLYKNEICPICEQTLIFNNDHSKVNCKDKGCRFNMEQVYKDYPIVGNYDIDPEIFSLMILELIKYSSDDEAE